MSCSSATLMWEGYHVSDDETAAVVLEQLTGLSVANLGQSGYGSMQELEILRRFGLALQPKLVAWFFFEGNDLYDDEEFENMSIYLREHGTFETEKPKKKAKRGWASRWKAFPQASFTRHGFRHLRRLSHSLVPNGVSTFGWFRDEDDRWHRLYFWDYAQLKFTEYEQKRFAKTQQTLLAAQRECKEQDIRLVVYFVPMKFRVYREHCRFPPHSPCSQWEPWDLGDRLAEFCLEANIEFVDLTGLMGAAAGSGRLLYKTEDTHWNVAGQRFVAEMLRKAWLEGETTQN